MNALKIKLLDGIIAHMKNSQGGRLKHRMSPPSPPKMPSMDDENPMEEHMESPMEESMEDKMQQPKGVAIEKVSIMGKPKIPGISMGKHHRIAAPGPKDHDLQALIDKKTGGGVGAEPAGDSDMNDDELKELLSQYGL